MMNTLVQILVLLALLGSALMAGLFFIFSNTIMTAFSRLPDNEGIHAMRSINRVILNPLFIGWFMGTAILSLVIGILAIIRWGDLASPWLFSAACLYLLGTFFVTVARNVPLNEQLEKVPEVEASGFWNIYLKQWTRYNHSRTVSSFLSVVLYAIGLMQA